MKKRVMSLMMVFAMLLSAFGVLSFAEEASAAAKPKITLSKKSVKLNSSETFNLTAKITQNGKVINDAATFSFEDLDDDNEYIQLCPNFLEGGVNCYTVLAKRPTAKTVTIKITYGSAVAKCKVKLTGKADEYKVNAKKKTLKVGKMTTVTIKSNVKTDYSMNSPAVSDNLKVTKKKISGKTMTLTVKAIAKGKGTIRMDSWESGSYSEYITVK